MIPFPTVTTKHRFVLGNLADLARTIVSNPLIAYGGIILLQLRIIWDIWKYKDLISGDTSSYFLDASSWVHGLHDDIVWSPLYTDFWGTITALFEGHVYSAEIVQRILIVLAATLLVLALMRALLGPAMGLLVTVWWTIIPANYNVLYEVHLFSVLPLLVAAVIVARVPGRNAIGMGFAIFVGTTLLLRNELIIGTMLFGAAIVIYEIRERRIRPVRASVYLRAFGVPLLIAGLLATVLYWRSFDQGHSVAESLHAKSALNLCQSYAFNYQQRHPTRFTGNAFTECQPLMRQVFGKSEPSFLQATVADPRAMAAYVLWNGRLLASGLQVALFNATSTEDQPDYAPVEIDRSYALALSVVALALIIAGGWTLSQEPLLRREWLKEHGWVVVVFGSVATTTIFVTLLERPRPEYMYAMTIGIMAIFGACLAALLRRVRGTQFLALVALGVTVALLLTIPSYYRAGRRPLHDAIERLWTIRPQLDKPGSVLVASGHNYEICAYLAQDYSHYCTSPSWQSLLGQIAGSVPIGQILNNVKATAIYADATLLGNPAIARVVAAPHVYGWRLVAQGTGEEGQWNILVRAT